MGKKPHPASSSTPRGKFIGRLRRALKLASQPLQQRYQLTSTRRRRRITSGQQQGLPTGTSRSPLAFAESLDGDGEDDDESDEDEDDTDDADDEDSSSEAAARWARARSPSPEPDPELVRRRERSASVEPCDDRRACSSPPSPARSSGSTSPPASSTDRPRSPSTSPTASPDRSSSPTEMSSASGSPPGSPAAGGNKKDDEDGASPPAKNLADDLSDDDSELSDVDEAQFEDFDPTALALDVREVADEETVKLLGRHKRKREEGAEADAGKKKKKEGRREKERKERKQREKKERVDDDFVQGEVLEGKRRQKDGGPRERKKPAVPEVNEEDLTPEERRRRALDRAMDAALKRPNQSRRRKHGDIDLTSSADEEIADLRNRMADAAAADVDARSADPPRPAMHKLKLLPEVVALLNRNGREIENAIVDPENNLLESVRFFLEPLRDGSLPAYNIQRELFAALGKLPVDKEALRSSGLGKVVVFYTKAKKVELPIRRGAERLLAEWTRPILKRSDDFRMRQFETRAYDPQAVAAAAAAQKHRNKNKPGAVEETPEQRRARQLAPPSKDNRARIDVQTQSYSIVPQNHATHGALDLARPMGASGDEAFRRMRARQLAATGRGRSGR